MIILLRNNVSEELLAAALLHDVVEDEEVTLQELTENFGKGVGYLVEKVTEPLSLIQGTDRRKSWRARKEHTINSLQNATKDVKMLACADKLANVSDMLQNYSSIGEKLWLKFNATKLNQQWYFDSLVEVFAQKPHSLSAYPYYQEFKEKVKVLFH